MVAGQRGWTVWLSASSVTRGDHDRPQTDAAPPTLRVNFLPPKNAHRHLLESPPRERCSVLLSCCAFCHRVIMTASEPAALAAASQATTTEARVLTGEWPMSSRQDRVAERIRAHAAGGRTRHDIVLDRSYVGKLIGQRGNNLQALRQGTQCDVFVLDKEGPPPGFDADHRLVVLMGSEEQVDAARLEIERVLTVPGYKPGRRRERSALAASLAETMAEDAVAAVGSDGLLEAPPPPAHQARSRSRASPRLLSRCAHLDLLLDVHRSWCGISSARRSPSGCPRSTTRGRWRQKGPSTLYGTRAPSARRVPPGAQAAPTHPGAPPGHCSRCGGLRGSPPAAPELRSLAAFAPQAALLRMARPPKDRPQDLTLMVSVRPAPPLAWAAALAPHRAA